MRTLRSEDMYMFPVSHDIYAVVPIRLWWAPWRWKLQVYRWTELNNSMPSEYIATNISRAEVIGLIKLLGYEQEIKC